MVTVKKGKQPNKSLVSKFVSSFAGNGGSSGGSSTASGSGSKKSSSGGNSSKKKSGSSNIKKKQQSGLQFTKKSSQPDFSKVSKFVSAFSNKKQGSINGKSTGNFGGGVQTNSQKTKIIQSFGGKVNTKQPSVGKISFTNTIPTKQPDKSKLAFFLQPSFQTTKFEAKQSAEKNPKKAPPTGIFGGSSKTTGAPSIFDDPNSPFFNVFNGNAGSAKLPPKGDDSKGSQQVPIANGEPQGILGDIFNFFNLGDGGGAQTGSKENGDITLDFSPVTIDEEIPEAPELLGLDTGSLGGGSDESDGDSSKGGFLQNLTKDPVVFGASAVAVIALVAGLAKRR